jgi:hypothetical protein
MAREIPCLADRFRNNAQASLTARATAGDTMLDLQVEEHHAVDAVGVEHRTLAAHVMLLEIVPGITLQLMGHAPPGRCCSELQLEAMAIEWPPGSRARAVRAVARALARVCEEPGTCAFRRPKQPTRPS